MNMSPNNWYSQRQSPIETFVYGAEFVTMKVGVAILSAIPYKLMMRGFPKFGPTYNYGDDMYVIHNTLEPESTLKKFNATAYHAVCESVA